MATETPSPATATRGTSPPPAKGSDRPAGTLGRRRRPAWLLEAGAVVVLALVIRLLYGRGWEHYDSVYSLIWGHDLAHGHTPPDIGALASPTEHPLANLVGAVLNPLGFHGLAALELINVLALAVVVWAAFHLGRTLFSAPVGVAFALIMLVAPKLVGQTIESSTDTPFLALVLAAAALEAARPRRGWAPMALLAVAGLLRPEAWLLAALYWLWVVRPASWRSRIGLAVLGAAPAVAWLGFDATVTGDALKSLHGTQAAAAHIHRPMGLVTAVRQGPGDLAGVYGPWIAAGGSLGFVAALGLLRRRALLPVALIAVGCGAFLAIGLAHLSLISRYLFVPATMVALFCAVAIAGWSALEPGHRLRRPWMVAGAVVGIAVAAGFGVHAARTLPGLVSDAARTSRDDGQLRALVRDPAFGAELARCGPVQTNDFRARPMLALLLATHPERYVLVHVRSAVRPGGGYLESVRQPHAGAVAAGMRIVDRRGAWTLYDGCGAFE